MLGLETEYALFTAPEKTYEALSEVLRRENLCLGAAYRKEGIFLATGGLVHFEGGLLELATPECTTARQCVAHHRALEKRVLAAGVVLGKHSADHDGHTYGTHENYQVEDRPAAALYALVALYRLVTLPLALIQGVVYATALAGCLAERLQALARLVTRRLAMVKDAPPGWPSRLTELAVDVLVRLRAFEEKRLHPWLARAAARVTFPVYRAHLTPFLVTRPIFTGPGWLQNGRFTLSPKAPAMGVKPILDIKNLLSEGLLARSKRLQVAYSDNTMSEYALWLKLSTTELVVRALEAGFVPERVELADPLTALQVVNADLTFRRTLALDGSPGWSALEIQHRYLACARRYVDVYRHEDPEAKQVLAAWQETLEQIERDPMALGDRLDWVAKKDLMDEAIEEAGSSWDAIARAFPALKYMEEKNVALGRAIDRPDEVRAWMTARLQGDAPGLDERLRSQNLRWEQLPGLYRLFYQLVKLDLRYHELGDGYHQQLEDAGHFRRVLAPEELQRALDAPPSDTRAHLRGHYVREVARLGLEARVSWDRLVVDSDYRVVKMDDPLRAGPPEDLEPKPVGPLQAIAQLVGFLPNLLRD